MESMNRGFTVLIIHISHYITRYELFQQKNNKISVEHNIYSQPDA
jgi:hypothetical protein